MKTSVALEGFLAGFPDSPASWAQATDELPDMYAWMTETFNAQPHEGPDLVPVGRNNCRTPTEWNQKYKVAIRGALARFDESTVKKFRSWFSVWLDLPSRCRRCGTVQRGVEVGTCAGATPGDPTCGGHLDLLDEAAP